MSNNTIKWKDIKIGAEFNDGSKVTEIHESIIDDCYAVSTEIPLSKNSHIKVKLWKKRKYASVSSYYGKKEITIMGKDHLLMVDLSRSSENAKSNTEDIFKDYQIPITWNRHIYYENEDEMSKDIEDVDKQKEIGEHPSHIKYNNSVRESMEVATSDPAYIGEDKWWLPIGYIHQLIKMGEIVMCKDKPLDTRYVGRRSCFCVATDNHKYETNGMIHHNSVLLQNIIFHTLTHGSDMAIALVDLKFTEFSQYKKFKNVVAVANNVREARELMLIARRVMDKRNKEMSQIGLKDMMKQKPKDFTGEIIIAGRKVDPQTKLDIRTADGEELQVTAEELEKYLEWDK